MFKKLFLAEIVSLIFGPVTFLLLMPYLIVYRQTLSFPYSLKWGIFSAIFIFIGIAFLITGRIKGKFSDQDLSIREERERFYIFALVLGFLYLAAALIFKGLLFNLSIASLGIFVAIVIFTVINKFIKASIHMAAACAFITSMLIFFGINSLFLVWIIPLVAWSRIALRRHSVPELIVGGLLGTLITVGTFFVARFYI